MSDKPGEGQQSRYQAEGPFFCERDLFNYYYRQERVKRDRTSRPVYLGTLALTGLDGRAPSPDSLKQAIEKLQETLRSSLRKGDVVTRWNDSQFMLLLQCSDLEQTERVLQRLELRFREIFANPELVLHNRCQNLPQPE